MIKYIELKRCVHRKLKKSVGDSFIKFLCERQILLWDLKKTRNWISKTAYVMLYKGKAGASTSSPLGTRHCLVKLKVGMTWVLVLCPRTVKRF